MSNISVAMATYNGEKFISQQLESIINQTVIPDEIIVCDDNSSDKSIEIINKILGNTNINYKIIRHDVNKGLVRSFRDAIDMSTGDIVFLCDQDDVWIQDKIEKVVSSFDEKDCVLAISNAYLTDDNLVKQSMTLWDLLSFNGVAMINKKNIYAEMLKRNIFTGMCMAFRKDFWVKVSECPRCMIHDEWIAWNAINEGKIRFISEPLVLYRQHHNNVVGSKKYSKFVSFRNAKEKIMASSEKKYDKLQYLNSVSEDIMLKHMIQDSLPFIKWRTQIGKKNVIRDLFDFILFIVKRQYKTYTSATEYAILKDLFCIFYRRE